MSLTDDDKQWLHGEMATIRTELYGGIERIEGKIAQVEAKIERVETALMTAFQAHLTEHSAQLRTEFAERLERVETRLLTEFHKWASPTDKRIAGLMSFAGATSEELQHIKARIDELEAKRKGSAE